MPALSHQLGSSTRAFIFGLFTIPVKLTYEASDHRLLSDYEDVKLHYLVTHPKLYRFGKIIGLGVPLAAGLFLPHPWH